MAKMACLADNTLFWVRAFSKIPNKITIVCVLFIKLNQSLNTKPKTCFFRSKNKIVLKLKFQICIFAFVFYCKRKLHINFHKKY